MKNIDLNSDLGESFGAWNMGNDVQILDLVSSANIACGFHAGDPTVMHQTVKNALHKNVAVGAHPGLPDLVGFGRRNITISAQDAYDMVIYQVGALNGFLTALGGKLHHVKPHGALYNMAATRPDLALAIAKAVYAINPNTILYGLAGSESIKQAELVGLTTANEVFADRSYQDDGSLTPRAQAGALLESDEAAVNQVLTMIKEGIVRTLQGNNIPLQADTVCIHGDGAHALIFAEKINGALAQANIQVKAL